MKRSFSKKAISQGSIQPDQGPILITPHTDSRHTLTQTERYKYDHDNHGNHDNHDNHVITWFSGVARDGKIIRPKAGTRKASAVFTLNGDYENDGDDAEDDDMMMIVNNIMSSKPTATFCTVSRSRTEEATTLSEMIPARRE